MKKTRYNLGQIILFSRINGPDIQALQTWTHCCNGHHAAIKTFPGMPSFILFFR